MTTPNNVYDAWKAEQELKRRHADMDETHNAAEFWEKLVAEEARRKLEKEKAS